MASVELPEGVKSVEVLRLEPGDWLVCRCDQPLNEHQRMHVMEEVKRAYGWDNVTVANPGFTLQVLRKEEADAMPPASSQPV